MAAIEEGRDQFELNQRFDYSTPAYTVSIAWSKIGDLEKPPVILIHGTPWSSFVYQQLVEALQNRYCVYLYDHPGFALSPQPVFSDSTKDDLDPSLSLRAEASAALIKHWNLKQAPHVVAHDNGGLVSLRLYLQHDIQFASLCLIDVVAISASESPFFKLVAENEGVFCQIPPQFQAGFIQAYVKSASHIGLGKDIEDKLSAQWVEGGAQGPKRFFQEMVQAHHRDIGMISGSYSRIGKEIPVKIIWGKEDTWIPVVQAEKLKEMLHAKEVTIVNNAGHLIHYDQPSQLAIEIGLWLMGHTHT